MRKFLKAIATLPIAFALSLAVLVTDAHDHNVIEHSAQPNAHDHNKPQD